MLLRRLQRTLLVAILTGSATMAAGCVDFECSATDAGCNPLLELLRNALTTGPVRQARFVYILNNNNSTVDAYRVDYATGMLSLLGVTPISANPTRLDIDPRGEYLAAVSPGDVVELLEIDTQSGALTLRETEPLGGQPWDVSFHPGLDVAYVSQYSTMEVIALELDRSAGQFQTGLGGQGIGQQPRELDISPDGAFIYAGAEGPNQLAILPLDAMGGLTDPGIRYTLGGDLPEGVLADPRGGNVYLTTQFEIYSVQIQTGTGTPSSAGAFVPGGTDHRLADILPASNSLYVANGGDNSILRYPLLNGGQNFGASTELSFASIVPTSVAVDPAGRYLYAAIDNTNQVGAFRIDAATGDLSLIQFRADGGIPIDVVVAAY